MMLTLYHVRVDDLDRDTAFALCGPPNPERAQLAARLFADGWYEPVAEIADPATLEQAFAWTQNVDRDWSRKPPEGVTPLEPTVFIAHRRGWGRRSTMVGDIIAHATGTVVTRHVVDWAGFAALSA